MGAIVCSGGGLIEPAIWWVNSSLSLGEAFREWRQGVCISIGDSAEKVEHDLIGFHFRVGGTAHLAHLVEEGCSTPSLLERLRNDCSPPNRIGESPQSDRSRVAARGAHTQKRRGCA
jgi:hypothetical protein